MPYAGKSMMARDVCAFGVEEPVFKERKVELLAVSGAESAFSQGAWHDNFPASIKLTIAKDELAEQPWLLEGQTVLEYRDAVFEAGKAMLPKGSVAEALLESPASRDCGNGQINIPGRLIGTSTEADLRTESLNPAVYEQVLRNNLAAMADLFESPWIFPDGKRAPRQWQPWVAAKSGWPWYPEVWVWHREAGQPAGPWVKTGMYLQKAIRGVANYWYFHEHRSSDWCLKEANRLAAIYHVPLSSSYWLDFNTKDGVFWHFPPRPTAPPPDPWAAYPKPNDGRSVIAPL